MRRADDDDVYKNRELGTRPGESDAANMLGLALLCVFFFALGFVLGWLI